MSKDKYGFEQNPIQRKINTAIHKFQMFYYGIRNYTKNLYSKGNVLTHTWIYWELREPLKISYETRSTGHYCHKCDKDHLEYRRNFERYIWSKKIKYINTNCTCEEMLFAPLDSWYNSGGEEGSPLFAGANSQWRIVEKGRLPIARYYGE